MENRKKILEVSKLNKYFNKSGKLVKVLDNITFDVYEGDFLGIIGESGSGKSTTGKCIIRLYSSSSGNILFDNTIINQKKLPKKYKHWLYRNMSMIFQDPMSSLNPRKNILSLISEPLVINKTISNDTRKILKECYEINPYFHNTFKWQDYNLTKEYLLKFYEENLVLFETTMKQLKDTSNDLNGLTQMRDILIDLENNYKSSLLIYAEYVKYIKLLLEYNIKKYQLDELEKSEINYRHAKENLNLEKKYTKAPKQYWDIKAIKDNLELKLNEFLAQNDFIYNEQNMSRLKSIKDKYSSEMKSLKQKAILTDSVTENIYERVNLQILKDTLKAMDKIDKDIYVDQDEIENFSNFINEKISEKYLPLIKTIHELGTINDELSQMSLQNTNESTIKEKLANYNNIYLVIKQQLNQFKHSDPISENIDVANAVKVINEKSASMKRSLQFEKLAREDEIEKLKHELATIKLNFDQSNWKHINVNYYEAQHDLKIAKEYRKELDSQDRNYFKENICPLIKQQNNTIQLYIEKITQIQKEIKKFTKKRANELRKKLIKTNKNDVQLKNNFDIIANEIAVKNDAINAINFEIDTYNQDVNLYRRIRKENWLWLYANYHSLSQSLTRQYVYDVLNEVGLKNEHAYRYPHEFSGGQRQRIVIARALISKPKLVIADEPISALDVSIQAQVINIMKNLAKKYNITFLFIAHDLSMVRHTSNRLIILHKGKIVEKGNTEEVFNNPIHPYTKSLIKASPELSKIHVDLASFSSKLDYDKNYSPNNAPSFFQVENEQEHFVFATEEQFKRWTKL